MSMEVIFNSDCSKINLSSQLYFCSHYKSCCYDFKRFLHAHNDFTEIVFVKRGSGEYQIDGTIYNVHPGNILVFNSCIAHDELLCDDTEIETYCCAVKNLCIKGLRPNALISDNINPIFETNHLDQTTLNYFTLIFDLLKINKYKESQSTFEKLLIFLNRNIFKHKNIKNDYLFLDQIKNYIEHYFFEQISIDHMSKKANVSRDYLAHEFKKKYHCPPGRYLINRRIGEAQTLLQNTELRILDVSLYSGFNSVQHFQYTFKKLVGVTPKQFRKEYQKYNNLNKKLIGKGFFIVTSYNN